MRNQQGFTLIEIIAVLILLGILAAVAVPKYMDMQDKAREKAAVGQIAEVKGRLSSALAAYMLDNNGAQPTGAQLLTEAENLVADSCPTTEVDEGDFTFKCAASGNTITITVTDVQGTALTSNNTGTFTY